MTSVGGRRWAPAYAVRQLTLLSPVPDHDCSPAFCIFIPPPLLWTRKSVRHTLQYLIKGLSSIAASQHRITAERAVPFNWGNTSNMNSRKRCERGSRNSRGSLAGDSGLRHTSLHNSLLFSSSQQTPCRPSTVSTKYPLLRNAARRRGSIRAAKGV